MAQIEGSVVVNVNANQAISELAKLEAKASELRQEIIRTSKQEVLNPEHIRQLKNELKQVENEQKKLRQSASDYKTVLKNLSSASINQLQKAANQLSYELKGLTRNTEEWKQKVGQLGQINAQLTTAKMKMRGVKEEVSDTNPLLNKLVSGFNKFGGAALTAFAGVTAAITGLVFAISKLLDINSQFEDSFSNVLTLLSGDQIAKFSDELKGGAINTMTKFGLEVKDVNKSLFDTISAGVDASKSIEVLNAAGILAAGGVTSLSTATDGLTTIMNAFHLSTDQAKNVADAFFSAQKFGKTTVEELANEIGKVAPIVNGVGLSYQEMLAALAELTKNGIGTAEATTYLKGAIQSLIKPSAEAEKILRAYGVPVGITEIKAAGLGKTLQALNNLMEKNPDIISDAIPSLEGLTGILSLSGEAMQDYNTILQTMNNDIGEGSSLMQAYNIKTETTAFKMKQAKAEFQAAALSLGDQLNPALVSATNFTKKITLVLIEAIKETKEYGKSLNELGEDIVKNLTPVGETQKTLNQQADEINEKIIKGHKEATKSLFNFFMSQEKYAIKPASFFLKLVTNIFNSLKHLFESISNNIKESGEKTKKNLQPAIDWFEKVFKPIIQWISKYLIPDFSKFGDQIDRNFLKLKKFFDLLDKTKKNQTIDARSYDSDPKQVTNSNKKNPFDVFGDFQPSFVPNVNANVQNQIIQQENKEQENNLPKIIQEKKSNLKEYLEFVRNINKELLQDEYKKAIEEINIWNEQEKEKINGWVITEEQKNNALLLLEQQYNQKLEEINSSYTEKRKKAVDEIVKFVEDREKKLHQTKEEIQEREIEAIAQQYDEQMKLAENIAEKYPQLREQMLEKIAQLELLKTEEINNYKLEKEKEFQKQVQEAREQYNLISEEEQLQITIQQLEDVYGQKLLTEEEYQKAKQDIIDRYNQKELEKAQKLAEEELKAKQKSVEELSAVINSYGDFISQAQQNELEAVGENEEKKKEINKRYAQINFEVQIAKILATTALAVMQALAELGPIAGPIAAAFIGTTGLMQLQAAEIQKNKVMGLEEGGLIAVQRLQDNKSFVAQSTENRGMISKPSVLVAENGPEYVIPNEGLQNPYILSFVTMMEIARQQGNLRKFQMPKIKGFADGGATEKITNNYITNDQLLLALNEKMELLITITKDFSNKIDNWANSLHVDYSSFKQTDDKIQNIIKKIKF